MTNYGYLIYIVRAHERYRRDATLNLNTLGGAGHLRDKITDRLTELRSGRDVHADERAEQAFTVLDVRLPGPYVWLTAEAGAFGNRGATTNVDTGKRRPFTHRDANMTPKRAMFVIPPEESEVGFLFCERVGGSHLRSHLDAAVLKEVSRDTHTTIRLETYVDLPAWDAFVAEAEAYQVKSVWRPTTLEDRLSGGDVRSEGELSMSLTGGAAERAIRSLRSALRAKFSGGVGAVGVEVATPESLRPADADAFERRRIEVTLDGPAGRRTIVIEREAPPAFIYPLDGERTEEDLYEVWVQEAVRVAEAYGLDVGADWNGHFQTP